MPRARTTTDLLADVRARVAAPTANDLISSTELLALADQEMRTELAEIIISMRSEYWLADYTVSISSGTASYRMPDRALGMSLRDVTVYDANGREYNCSQIPADQRYLWTRGQTWTATGPFVFTLDNDEITLLPTPAASSAGYTLRARYYKRPSELVAVASCLSFYFATDSTSITTIEQTPSDVFSANDYVDLVRGDGMHAAVETDRVIDSIDDMTATVTFNSDTPIDADAFPSPSPLPVGKTTHYITPASYTCVPPVPDSMYPLLVALTSRAYCEAIGDMRGMEAAAAMYERKRRTALGIMQPRVDGEVQRITPIFSPLRGGRSGGGRGWW